MGFKTLEEINNFIEESGHPAFYIKQYGDVFALYEKRLHSMQLWGNASTQTPYTIKTCGYNDVYLG